MNFNRCNLVDLHTINADTGSITVIDNEANLPFKIRRIYYLYAMPSDVNRTPHGHRRLQQLLVAINGSFDIAVENGAEREVISMDSPSVGLYIPPNVWRDIRNVAPGTIILVLASEPYDELDYYRDHKIFFEDTGLNA